MVQSILSQPVQALMRPAPIVAPETSIEAAATIVREGGVGLALVVGGELLGAVTERTLFEALGNGVSPFAPATMAMTNWASFISPAASGAEALRRFSEGAELLVVLDLRGFPAGIVTPSDLWPKRVPPDLPSRVGGMATPFGVYLTTGNIRAGAGDIALVSTGVLLFAILAVANYVGLEAGRYVFTQWGWSHGVATAILNVVPIALFLASLRLLPLAGIHAAEHKVVHAIERGEELNAENVRRMPRVHPRCGTNIAVGASIFFGLAGWQAIHDDHLRLALAFLATLALWRPIGSLAQYWITTREPSERHIEMGIRSGRELLKRHVMSRGRSASFLTRIWNTGMLHVLAGSALFYGCLYGLFMLLGLEPPL